MVWMPVIGNAAEGQTLITSKVSGKDGSLNVNSDGTIAWDSFAVTFDQTSSAALKQASPHDWTLRDLVWGNEWSLRRIVGKCHMVYSTFITDSPSDIVGPPAIEAAAGFIVLRTDDEGTLETDLNECNPLVQDSADDPWIWRRKWILSSAKSNSAGLDLDYQTLNNYIANPAFGWPCTTAGYGSVMDGPHIDAKTARSIKRQERLYFVIAARCYDPDNAFNVNANVTNNDGYLFYNIDFRLLGRLGGSVGNRNNASR